MKRDRGSYSGQSAFGTCVDSVLSPTPSRTVIPSHSAPCFMPSLALGELDTRFPQKTGNGGKHAMRPALPLNARIFRVCLSLLLSSLPSPVSHRGMPACAELLNLASLVVLASVPDRADVPDSASSFSILFNLPPPCLGIPMPFS